MLSKISILRPKIDKTLICIRSLFVGNHLFSHFDLQCSLQFNANRFQNVKSWEDRQRFVSLSGQTQFRSHKNGVIVKMNNTSANDLGGEETSFGLKPTFAYPVAACYIAITAVAIVGNLMVCYAILANKNLRNNPTNLMLLSLAVSDFLTVTLVVPFDLESLFLDGVWKHGKVMCITWQFVYLFIIPVSIFSLLAISVERYKTLSDPHYWYWRSRFMNKKRALIVIVIIWIYSILWALFPFMGWRGKGGPVDDGVCMLPYTRLYNILSSFLKIILPLQLSGVFSILTYRIIQVHHKSLKNGDLPSTQQPTKEQYVMYLENVKTAKRSLVFVLALFLCWQPYSLFVIADSIDGHNWKSFPYEVYMVLLMLGYLNSALNPFLLAFRNKHFKAVYANTFCLLKNRSPNMSIQNATELDTK